MDILEAAIECARYYHNGEHQREAPGSYLEHLKAVAGRVETKEEKVLAWLQDIVEHAVVRKLGRDISPQEEEAFIWKTFDEISAFFKERNCDIEPFIPDIDVMTTRKGKRDKKYDTYITRLIDYAWGMGDMRVVTVKMAVLEENMRPERNNPPDDVYHQGRSKRYAVALKLLKKFYSSYGKEEHASSRPVKMPGQGGNLQGLNGATG